MGMIGFDGGGRLVIAGRGAGIPR